MTTGMQEKTRYSYGTDADIVVGEGEPGVRSQNVAGSVPAASGTAGISVKHYSGDGRWVRSVFELDEVTINTTDGGGSGAHGTIQMFTFPAGDIVVQGGQVRATSITKTAGLTDAAVIDFGVGETAVSSATETLSGDEENLVAGNTITLSGGTGSGNIAPEVTGDTITGNSTDGDPGEAHLNVAVSAATSSANSTVTFTGEVELWWYNAGDY